ncbi:hypothetical protein [Muricoccus pecuniae]|uniref:Uncharacterized protein n=1 Tax=Muricoccus pecuniae TaxID=693023 RepID=A0A840Y653_9PROT|nr:hypothetical protein [Roseomonas pecuniae]MBB5694249.1 hypothetical protein [Roseomonas pecuniae]
MRKLEEPREVSDASKQRQEPIFTLSLRLVVFLASIACVYFIWGNEYYTRSSDLALHYGLAEFISASKTWPDRFWPHLEVMSSYPPVTHTLGALIGVFTGTTFTGVNTIALLSVFGIYLCFLRLMQSDRIGEVAASYIVFLVTIYQLHPYNIISGGEIRGYNFYYGQIVSFAMYLMLTTPIFLSELRPLVLAPLMSLLVFAFGWVYPMAVVQLACATLAFFGLQVGQHFVRNRNISLNRIAPLALTSLAFPLLIVGHPTFADMRANAQYEGGIDIALPLHLVQITVLICGLPLCVLALLSIFSRTINHREIVFSAVSLGIFGAALVQILALNFGIGSNYGVSKHIFGVVTVTAAVTSYLLSKSVFGLLRPSLWQPDSGFVRFAPAFVAVVTISIVMHGSSYSQQPFLRAREFLIENLPADGRHQTASVSKNLSPAENFALSLGDMQYNKVASAVVALGDNIVADPQIAANIRSRSPLRYIAFSSRSTPSFTEPCLIAQSENAGLVLARAECTGDKTVYTVGQWITVPDLREDKPFLRDGWSSVESWGVWSDGAEARLSFLLDMPVEGRLRLEMRAHAFLNAQTLRQRVQIAVNGRDVGQWVFDNNANSSERTISFPGSYISGDVLEIDFRFPDAARPSPDERLLGMGVVAFRLLKD